MDVAVLRLLLWHGDLAFWCLFWWQETNILCQNMSICWKTKLRMIAFHKTCCFYIVPYCVVNLHAHISTDFNLCPFKSPTCQRTIEITSCMPFSSIIICPISAFKPSNLKECSSATTSNPWRSCHHGSCQPYLSRSCFLRWWMLGCIVIELSAMRGVVIPIVKIFGHAQGITQFEP